MLGFVLRRVGVFVAKKAASRIFKNSIIATIIGWLVSGLLFGWAAFCVLFLVGAAGFGIYMLIEWLRGRL